MQKGRREELKKESVSKRNEGLTLWKILSLSMLQRRGELALRRTPEVGEHH